MVQDPGDEGGAGDGALGFDESKPKGEKYNTRFIVSNMQAEARKKRLIAFGIMGALALGIILYTVLKPPAPPKPHGAGAAEAHGPATTPAEHGAPAKAEAPKPEAPKGDAPKADAPKAEAPATPK